MPALPNKDLGFDGKFPQATYQKALLLLRLYLRKMIMGTYKVGSTKNFIIILFIMMKNGNKELNTSIQ